jgi:hypothetical protein
VWGVDGLAGDALADGSLQTRTCRPCPTRSNRAGVALSVARISSGAARDRFAVIAVMVAEHADTTIATHADPGRFGAPGAPRAAFSFAPPVALHAA